MTENQENILSQIMDTKNVHEKLKLLEDNRDLLDARMLGNLAVIFDILPDTENPEELYEHIVQYLQTRARFEPERLR